MAELLSFPLPLWAIIDPRTHRPVSATREGIRFLPVFEDEGGADRFVAENQLPGIPIVEFRNRQEIQELFEKAQAMGCSHACFMSARRPGMTGYELPELIRSLRADPSQN